MGWAPTGSHRSRVAGAARTIARPSRLPRGIRLSPVHQQIPSDPSTDLPRDRAATVARRHGSILVPQRCRRLRPLGCWSRRYSYVPCVGRVSPSLDATVGYNVPGTAGLEQLGVQPSSRFFSLTSAPVSEIRMPSSRAKLRTNASAFGVNEMATPRLSSGNAP